MLRGAPLDQWVWRDPTPFGFTGHKVVYADGKFGLVGQGGYAGVSTNGWDWQTEPHFEARVLSELFHVNGHWFASGYVDPGVGGRVTMGSSDGLHYSRLSDERFSAVVFHRGTYVAAADFGIYRSTDGEAWELWSANDSQVVSLAVTADQRLVGLTYDGALVGSLTGTNWTVQFSPGGLGAKFLLSFGGVLYALGDNLLAASRDGLTWTAQNVTTPPWALGGLFTEKCWIIFGQTQDLKPQVSRSFDEGKTWTVADWPFAWRTFGMAYGNGKILAVGEGVGISDDGVKWESVTQSASGLRDRITDLAYGNGRFAAWGGTNFSWSTDAIKWSLAETSGGVTGSVYNLVHGPAGFVAAGYAGMLAHSADGRVWSDVSIAKYRDDRHSVHDLKVFDGKYYALARSVLLESADGQNWRDYPLDGVYYRIEKLGARFAIAGPESGLRTSENLVDWTYVPAGQSALGLVSALDKMYAILWGGVIVTSDGVKWTPFEGPMFSPVAGFEGGILATRPDGSPYPSYPFFYSPDGTNWQQLGGPGRLQFRKVLFVNGRLIGVGESGGILEASYFGRLRIGDGANAQVNLSIESGVTRPRFQISHDLQTWTDSDVNVDSNFDSSSGQKFFRARLDSD